MVIKRRKVAIFVFIALVAYVLSTYGCYNPIQAKETEKIYNQKLAEFEKTRNVDAICSAADIIGSRQESFPMKKSKRAKKFVEHILTGLREAEKRELIEEQESCAYKIREALHVGRPKRLKQSWEMVDCLDKKATIDGVIGDIITADDYLTCAAKHNYTP